MSPTFSPQLINLARSLAGEFSNKEQAIAEPVWYVHLRLWQRPIPFAVLDGLALFAEQANVLHLDKPYRQRILRLQEVDGNIEVAYFAFRDPSAWQGAGTNRDRLAQIIFADLEPLSGCTLKVSSPQPEEFKAELPATSKCCFTYMGELRQVILGFEATASYFKSYDRGVDPNTGASIWGAIAGAYHFTKLQDFSAELPLVSTT